MGDHAAVCRVCLVFPKGSSLILIFRVDFGGMRTFLSMGIKIAKFIQRISDLLLQLLSYILFCCYVFVTMLHFRFITNSAHLLQQD
jgi:hypothetical protein